MNAKTENKINMNACLLALLIQDKFKYNFPVKINLAIILMMDYLIALIQIIKK